MDLIWDFIRAASPWVAMGLLLAPMSISRLKLQRSWTCSPVKIIFRKPSISGNIIKEYSSTEVAVKTLNNIQKLSKIGKVLSRIVFIFCIIGFCGCVIGILSMALGAPTLKIGGVTLESILSIEAGVTAGTAYAAMAAGMILCAGEAVLSKFAEHYFKRELVDGTPFDFGGAKELMRLGILAICIPIGTQIIAEIVYAVMEQTLRGVAPLQLDHSGSVALGVMFIVMSLGCRYGAELREEKRKICGKRYGQKREESVK